MVEFVVRKLPPSASRNLLKEMSVTVSALQKRPPQDTTRQPRLEPTNLLPDPWLSHGTQGSSCSTQNKRQREDDSSEEESECSSLDCVDLTFSTDADCDDSDFSPSEEEEEEESLSTPVKIPKGLEKSTKKSRLKAKDDLGVNDRFPRTQTVGFIKFLRSPAGGMKSNVNEVDSTVSKCLYYVDSEMLQWCNLLELGRVSDWLQMHTLCGDGPSALLNKIYYLQSGLKYLNYLSDDRHEQAKCSSALKELDTWKVRYRPLIKKRRAMIRDDMCSKDDDMICLKGYTDMVNDQSSRGKAWNLVNKGNSISREEFLYVMRYCLTLLVVKNAKRPGVLSGMTLEEWKRRSTCHGTKLKLVLVRDHKTACNGASHVYVEAEDESLIAAYINHIRPCAKNARCSSFVFISFNGTKLKNVSSQIGKLLSAGTKFSATKMRKVYSTCVGELGDYLKEKQMAELADHSQVTQQRFYAARRKRKQTA